MSLSIPVLSYSCPVYIMATNIADLVAPIKNAHGLHYKNPRFPLNIKLPQNLEAGQKIYIHGALSMTAARFAVNLKNAEVDANNYFHFNPRLDEGAVVRNSRLDESWGDEERDGEMPFEAGKPFLIGITPNVDHYEVEVNGAPFINYNHRDGMPLCDVTHISMWGDVSIYGIHLPVSSMPIPMNLRVPKHSFLGDIFLIDGEIPNDADRFHLNLQCGMQDDADILYHFNPRFGEDALVCNNRCADTWGDEERLDGIPVHAGQHFNLCIVVTKDGFLPFFNGNPLPIFAHRLDISAICTLVIDGDVKVETLTMDCAPRRLPPQVPGIDENNFEDLTTQALHVSSPITIPFHGPFADDKFVYISGKVDDNPARFAINLLCGETANDDVALHMNPRWDDDEGSVLVFNSKEGDTWGEEVRIANPMVAGEEVEIYIYGSAEGYKVLINGERVLEFEHRMDCSRVINVNFDGSFTLYRILAN